MGIRIAVTLACALIAALSIPLLLRRVPPNGLYGFRTPRTLSSPDIWYPANVFSARAMLIGVAVTAALTWIVPAGWHESAPVWILLASVLTVLGVSLWHLRRYR